MQEGTHIQAAATAAVTALSVGSFAAEELLSEGSTTSPAALISRLQQLQLSSRDAKSPLQLADLPPNSSRGVCSGALAVLDNVSLQSTGLVTSIKMHACREHPLRR